MLKFDFDFDFQRSWSLILIVIAENVRKDFDFILIFFIPWIQQTRRSD